MRIFELNNIWLTAVRCGWRILLNLIESLSANVTLICFTKEEQFTIPLIETDILRSPVVAISFFTLRRSKSSALETEHFFTSCEQCVLIFSPRLTQFIIAIAAPHWRRTHNIRFVFQEFCWIINLNYLSDMLSHSRIKVSKCQCFFIILFYVLFLTTTTFGGKM